MKWVVDAATSRHFIGYIKNKFKPRGIKMNFVTYYKLWLKCYINLFCIVPVEMGCGDVLARAIDKSPYFYNKKNKK